MVFGCLTWIPLFWSQLLGPFTFKEVVVRQLPDNIISDILSRLPADRVLECRRVCRHWKCLTSTPYFAKLHLKRATASLFVQCYDLGTLVRDELNLFIFDEESRKDTMITKIRASSTRMKRYRPLLMGSCDGLLLFRAHTGKIGPYFIFNPITQEETTICTPVEQCFIHGFFFHPSIGKYKLLCESFQDNMKQFFIYTLKDNMWRKITSFSYRPSTGAPPVIVSGSLHWMVQYSDKIVPSYPPCTSAIMVFHMDSEDFRVMPHPGNKCHSRGRHGEMHLVEMEEHLALCDLHVFDKLIEIWVLEDYANWTWVKNYKVDLNWDVKRYPFRFSGLIPNYFSYIIRILNIQNGELLLDWFVRGLFRYHLELNTIRQIKRTVINEEDEDVCVTLIYTKSLITLNNMPFGI